MSSTNTRAFKPCSEYVLLAQRSTTLAHLSLASCSHSRLGFQIHDQPIPPHSHLSRHFSHLLEHIPHLPRHSHIHRVPDRATEPKRHHAIPQRLIRATKVVIYGT